MLREPKLHPDVVAAERLGDEIAELSADIEVAMARLLDKISAFDAAFGRAEISYSKVRALTSRR